MALWLLEGGFDPSRRPGGALQAPGGMSRDLWNQVKAILNAQSVIIPAPDPRNRLAWRSGEWKSPDREHDASCRSSEPSIIDPRNTALPGWIRRLLHKRAVREGRLTHINRVKVPIDDVDLSSFDLVVAMHPDEATEPAMRKAIECQLDFAIVPLARPARALNSRQRPGWCLHVEARGGTCG